MSTLELRAAILARLRAAQHPLTACELGRVLGYAANSNTQMTRVLAGMADDGLVRRDRADPQRVTWRAA